MTHSTLLFKAFTVGQITGYQHDKMIKSFSGQQPQIVILMKQSYDLLSEDNEILLYKLCCWDNVSKKYLIYFHFWLSLKRCITS